MDFGTNAEMFDGSKINTFADEYERPVGENELVRTRCRVSRSTCGVLPALLEQPTLAAFCL